MKKILLIIAFFLFGFMTFHVTSTEVSAQECPANAKECLIPIEGEWVEDPEVTFTGKNAARSKELLNWTLRDYRWTFTEEGQTNPLETFWIVIRNIIYSLFILFVIATAFILIATRGKSLSAMRFIPRFFAIVLLVTFSFSLISLLYQTTDIVQGFFLRSPRVDNARCPPQCISQEDLFFIDWDYEKFIGYRQVGEKYAESAFINLLLVKLTAFTYYVMVGTLFIRKIILWFFIILSPVFPLLLLYYPVRNTAKIWIGEFFRWVLYAPLFAIFLAGLVQLWRSETNIPLNFDLPDGPAGEVIYPTATSILIGGPQMVLSLKNSANNVETFALYLVALLMLWMVILLPWVLLQIFLEYAMNYNYAESPAFKGLMGWANRSKQPPPAVPPGSPPPRKPGPDLPPMKKPIIPPSPPAGTGLARTIPTQTAAVYKTPTTLIKPMPSYVQTLRMTNMSVPTLRDIARFETAMVSNKASEIHEISRVKDTLTKLSNPASSSSQTDVARFSEMRERLIKESQSGNIMASTILNASHTMNVVNMTTNQITSHIRDTFSKISRPESITNVIERQKFASMHEKLNKASQQGNQFATVTLNQISTIAKAETPEQQKQEISKLKKSLVEEKQKGNELAKELVTFVDQETKPAALPAQNQVQTVSLEDYEAVRKMWTKNYQTMDVPQSVTKGNISRKEWIQDDINEITKTINMLSSSDPEIVDQGLQEVSTILPFLMMGGFTLPEIVAYLKAKQQAAADSLEQIKAKEEEEASMLDAETTTTATAVKHRSMSMPIEPSKASSAAIPGGTPVATTTITTPSLSSDDEDDDSGSMLSDITSQVARAPRKIVSIFPSMMNAIKLTPHSTPTLKDVVSYEASMLSGGQTVKQEVHQTQELLTQLADPTKITDPTKRHEIETMRNDLETKSRQGNLQAKAILDAAHTVVKLTSGTTQPVTVPAENKVQTVSLDDYETVKKMWEENYKNMEIPQNGSTQQLTRNEWIANDISEITRVINLLSSQDPKMVNEGLAAVSKILPFLLVGGFSLSEIIAYLKAKLEGAKAAQAQLAAVQHEEDQQEVVNEATKAPEQVQEMAMTAPEENEESKPVADDNESFFPTDDEEDKKPELKSLEDEKDLRELGQEPQGLKDLEELDKKEK